MTTPAPNGPSSSPTPTAPHRLQLFPVTFFTAVMGTAGLALAWLRASDALGLPAAIGAAVFWVALGLGLAVGSIYTLKAVRHPSAVRAELQHPVRIAFFPAITISILVLATAAAQVAEPLGRGLWWIGVAGQFIATFYVLAAWIGRTTFTTHHIGPAWFLAVVGLVFIPLAGERFGPSDLSWFAFSVGVFFWLALLPLVLGRIFAHESPLPPPLAPTIGILVVPPSLAFLAWVALGQEATGVVGHLLYDVAVAFVVLVALQVLRVGRLPFGLSWWAYGFPLAAFSSATTVMAAEAGGPTLVGAAWVVLIAATVLVSYLLWRTGKAVVARRICIPE